MGQSGAHMDVLTAEELAARLRMHVNTITKMAREGKLPSLRAGRDWRFYWPAVVETMSRPAGSGADDVEAVARGRHDDRASDRTNRMRADNDDSPGSE